jgi:hypothetical protein
LQKGKAFTPATFTIDTRECTAPGELGINVDGPMECQIDVKDNQNVQFCHKPRESKRKFRTLQCYNYVHTGQHIVLVNANVVP